MVVQKQFSPLIEVKNEKSLRNFQCTECFCGLIMAKITVNICWLRCLIVIGLHLSPKQHWPGSVRAYLLSLILLHLK